MTGIFGGTTAAYYARYRRGYPQQIIDAVVDRLHLGHNDATIDLGCGTGLLTVPLARAVGLVLGVDPEPDMLAEARRGTDAAIGSRIVWVLGSDADIPKLAALRGRGGWGAISVGQALHFIDHEALFERARDMLRPGGGIAIVSNGVPLWQQDADWSRALKSALTAWFGAPPTSTCGTADADRVRYRNALRRAGYELDQVAFEYEAQLTPADVVGSLFSAISPTDVPEDQADAFRKHILNALPDASFNEVVPVTALIGVAP